MKGVTVHYPGKFAIWQAKLKDEMPGSDSKSNPTLWWTKCLICQDYIVCGLDTKSETLEHTRKHDCEVNNE